MSTALTRSGARGPSVAYAATAPMISAPMIAAENAMRTALTPANIQRRRTAAGCSIYAARPRSGEGSFGRRGFGCGPAIGRKHGLVRERAHRWHGGLLRADAGYDADARGAVHAARIRRRVSAAASDRLAVTMAHAGMIGLHGRGRGLGCERQAGRN